jgi:hypothetical protein
MLAVNGVGKPCAGEPHARIDGRELETEQRVGHGREDERLGENPEITEGFTAYSRSVSPRQLPTLQPVVAGQRRVRQGVITSE